MMICRVSGWSPCLRGESSNILESRYMSNMVKALMIGDVIGQPGLKALFAGLGPPRQVHGRRHRGRQRRKRPGRLRHRQGRGRQALLDRGPGHHDREPRVGAARLRRAPRLDAPAPQARQLPSRARPAWGWAALESGGASWAVLNLQGREGMTPIDCPFRGADAALAVDRGGGAGKPRPRRLPR